MTDEPQTTPCKHCGMPVRDGEYHPHAACLMFEGCHNSESVRANLQAVLDRGEEIANAKRKI